MADLCLKLLNSIFFKISLWNGSCLLRNKRSLHFQDIIIHETVQSVCRSASYLVLTIDIVHVEDYSFINLPVCRSSMGRQYWNEKEYFYLQYIYIFCWTIFNFRNSFFSLMRIITCLLIQTSESHHILEKTWSATNKINILIFPTETFWKE